MNQEQAIQTSLDFITQDKLDNAQTTLKSGLAEFPNSAQLHFLLGAVYAQLKQYEDAIYTYKQAIHFDSTLYIAHFQLGLLLATLEKPLDAKNVLLPLKGMTDNYLGTFAQAVIAILDDHIDEALQLIQLGINTNQENINLNQDMFALAERLMASMEVSNDTVEPDMTDAEQPAETDKTHLLDIYQTKS